MDRATRPTRFLAALATLFLVVDGLFGAYLIVGAVWGVGPDGHAVGIHTAVPLDKLSGLPRGTISPNHVSVLVRIGDATRSQIRWAAGRDVPLALLIIVGLWLLRKLLISVRDGEPFVRRNAVRLRALAFLVLVGVPVARLISSVCESKLASSAGLTSRGASFSLPGEAVVAGLVILVLGEVFAAGVRMREDLEGTV